MALFRINYKATTEDEIRTILKSREYLLDGILKAQTFIDKMQEPKGIEIHILGARDSKRMQFNIHYTTGDESHWILGTVHLIRKDARIQYEKCDKATSDLLFHDTLFKDYCIPNKQQWARVTKHLFSNK